MDNKRINKYRNTINPRTNKFEPAIWVENYFGDGAHSVEFRDGNIYDSSKVDMDVIDVVPQEKPDGDTA